MAKKDDVRWPTDVPGAARDWFEITVPSDDPDEQGELLRLRFDVSFLLSTWKCIFGQGCPGVLISGAMEDRGCCQIGVHMEATDDDYKRVRKYVNMLTEEDLDADLLKIVRSGKGNNGWRYQDKDGEDGESTLPGYYWHTKVVDGACVLANRAGGSTGKLGCSLHVLANRLGLHHSDTKPNICWQIPMSVDTDYDEDTDQSTMTVTGTPASVWGSTHPHNMSSPGWWCTETPDAYVIGNQSSLPALPESVDEKVELETAGMVFRTNEIELRKLMGDQPYEMMAQVLREIHLSGGRRTAMPGETINEGRPLLPLMVKKRMDDWLDDETEESMEALQRSHPYMRVHEIKPDSYKLPRMLRATEVKQVEAAKVGGEDTIVTEVPVVEEPEEVAPGISATDEQLNAAAEASQHNA